MRLIIGVKKWAMLSTALTALAAALGLYVAVHQNRLPPPPPPVCGPPAPPPCNDAVAVLGAVEGLSYKLVNCNRGERIEIKTAGNLVLAMCWCPTVQR